MFKYRMFAEDSCLMDKDIKRVSERDRGREIVIDIGRESEDERRFNGQCNSTLFFCRLSTNNK